MSQTEIQQARPDRILIIDDDRSVHDAYRKALGAGETGNSSLQEREGLLFGESIRCDDDEFQIDSAYQGQEGLDRIREAAQSGRPYNMAFVDMRMPPGLDGLETISRIWDEFPGFQFVLCSAYSDYSWKETIERVGRTSDLLILKKPFEVVEIRQVACALIEKSHLKRQADLKMQELESMVQQRSSDLERLCRELREANTKLAAASCAKSEFLANMSHEIRTPMTAILGFTDLLADRLTDQDSINAITTITRNGEHLLEIINDILDLSKIETGQLDVERMPCAPGDILADVTSLMQVRSDAKGLPLLTEIASPVPSSINTDPTRVRQILINLIGNAIKFTKAGSVRIVTQLVDVVSDHPQLQFDVIDTGIGMSAEQLKTVFEPFVQANTSTTRNFGGTGLGLTISRRLAWLLGGDVTGTSVPGEGSNFRLTISTGPLNGIPMIPTRTGLDQRSKVHSKNLEQTSTNLDCRVLLAEDTPDNQRLVSFILKKSGAEVDIAENGQIAVDLATSAEAEGTPFDVILMDMQMPVLDGYEATRRLRGLGYHRPIIALTAHAMDSDREKCISAGCDDFVTKPIQREQLIALVSAYSQREPSIPG